MVDRDLARLDELIGKLSATAREAYQLSREIPAAECNLYMILRHLEMLEMEICDPIRVLREAGTSSGKGDSR